MGAYYATRQTTCSQAETPVYKSFDIDEVRSFNDCRLMVVTLMDSKMHNIVLLFREQDENPDPECVVIRADLIKQEHPVTQKDMSLARMKCWTISSLCAHYGWSMEYFERSVFDPRKLTYADYKSIQGCAMQYVIDHPEFHELYANCSHFKNKLWRFMMEAENENGSRNDSAMEIYGHSDDNEWQSSTLLTDVEPGQSVTEMNDDDESTEISQEGRRSEFEDDEWDELWNAGDE